MKVILNKDHAPLGEEGDVKDVAKGYARNYLFPRGIALPHNDKNIKLFESRKDEIEAKKVLKRNDAAGLKEKLESLNLEISMPAAANGKLYGAVTNQTLMDELAKQGFQIERKRIELTGSNFKNVGKYKAVIKLYENESAEISINVLGQEIKSETRSSPASRPGRRRRDERPPQSDQAPQEQAPADQDEAGDAAPEQASRDAAGAGENPSQAAPDETSGAASADDAQQA